MADYPQLYIYFGKDLYRLSTESIEYSTNFSDIDPSNIISGASISTISQASGILYSGKTSFTNNEIGYILGNDNGIPKFYIGTTTDYFNFDGANVAMSGSLTTGALIATAGTIAGWTIASEELSKGSFKIQSTAERILLGLATAPMTGKGIFMGKDSSDYEFRVGDPSNSKYMHFDGTDLFLGTVNVTDVINVATPGADDVPTGLEVSDSGITTADDGTTSAYVVINWNYFSSNTFSHFLIRYKKASYSYYNYITTVVYYMTIDGLVPNTSYNYGIASVNKFGTISAFSSDISNTTPADDVAPATVTGVSATGGIQYVIVEWTHNSETDLASYNIYRHTSDASGSSSLVGNCKTNYFIDGGRTGDTEYFYWVKALDTSGNISAAFSTVASATPRNVVTTDVTEIAADKILIDGVVYLTNWRHGSDLTKIDGGDIYANSVTITQLNFTPVQSTDVIAKINASAEGITIDADNLTINAATTFASGYDPILKAVTFAQDGVPTSLAVGDLWLDTNDNNKLYRAASVGADEITAGEWIAVPDENKLDVLGGSYDTAASGARVRIFPDANTGIQVIDDAAADVFKCVVGGTHVGDVIIGDWAGGQGIFYDKSAGTINLASQVSSLIINTSGYIRSGQTAYNTGTGWWIGDDSGTPKLSIGNAGGEKLTWDGSKVAIVGNIELSSMSGIGHYNDGATTSASGLSSATRRVIETSLIASEGVAKMYSDLFGTTIVDWDDNFTFLARLSITQVGGADERAFFGFADGTIGDWVSATGADPSPTNRHICFYMKEAGTLWASMADGTTREESQITGITLSSRNNYRIEWDSGTNAKFYVNSTLEATLSTNLPSGNTNPPNAYFEMAGVPSNAGGTIIMSNYWQVNSPD